MSSAARMARSRVGPARAARRTAYACACGSTSPGALGSLPGEAVAACRACSRSCRCGRRRPPSGCRTGGAAGRRRPPASACTRVRTAALGPCADVRAEARPRRARTRRAGARSSAPTSTDGRADRTRRSTPCARGAGTPTEQRRWRSATLSEPHARWLAGDAGSSTRWRRSPERRRRSARRTSSGRTARARDRQHPTTPRSGVEPCEADVRRAGGPEDAARTPTQPARKPDPAHGPCRPGRHRRPRRARRRSTRRSAGRSARGLGAAAGPAGCAAAGRRPRAPPGPAPPRWRARSTGGCCARVSAV